MSLGSGGIFGAPPKKPWGSSILDRNPWDTPPIHQRQEPQAQTPQVGAGPSDYPISAGAPGTPAKPGINWGGVLADALAGAAGQPGPFAAQQQYQRQQADQIAQEQRRQAAQYANFVAQKQWDRANPAAPAPTEFERTVLGAGIQPGTPEYAQIMRQRAETQASAPPMVVTNPDGTRTVYPAGAVPRGPAGPPTAPVGKLTPIPGGPMPSASGGFR